MPVGCSASIAIQPQPAPFKHRPPSSSAKNLATEQAQQRSSKNNSIIRARRCYTFSRADCGAKERGLRVAAPLELPLVLLALLDCRQEGMD